MPTKKKKEAEEPRKDYWDRIADDVSTGYGADDLKKSSRQEELLNEDQEPDDQERGDA